MVKTTDSQVAIVTGAGQRIGHAVAHALSEHGYHVVLHANTSLEKAQASADKLSRNGRQCIAIAADLRDTAAIERLIEESHRRFGRIDALINSAAIWNPKPLEQITPDDVRAHFEINTLATFICSQKVGQKMIDQPEGGVIINFCDWAVVRPYMNYAAYFPSKGAIPTLTRDLAVELAARNPRIRVNAILPGPILLADDMPEEQRAAAVAGTLVKREGTAEHMASAVLFFLQNDFITGVCLPVDGGRSIYATADSRGFEGADQG